jgi:hypothetical protein
MAYSLATDEVDELFDDEESPTEDSLTEEQVGGGPVQRHRRAPTPDQTTPTRLRSAIRTTPKATKEAHKAKDRRVQMAQAEEKIRSGASRPPAHNVPHPPTSPPRQSGHGDPFALPLPFQPPPPPVPQSVPLLPFRPPPPPVPRPLPPPLDSNEWSANSIKPPNDPHLQVPAPSHAPLSTPHSSHRPASASPRHASLDPQHPLPEPRSTFLEPRSRSLEPQHTILEPRSNLEPRGTHLEPPTSLEPRGTNLEHQVVSPDSPPQVPITTITPATPSPTKTATGRIPNDEAASVDESIIRMERMLTMELGNLSVTREQYLRVWLKNDTRGSNYWNTYTEYFTQHLDQELSRVPEGSSVTSRKFILLKSILAY